ncbi:DNA replication and repair protein RecF [Caldicellulosiruptor kronotskyensis 2002]|uniref:DNA replication and repair protein RecF n=1 Tax=Caldicellulosiruptor kronotskyensis (strain DSM 18902 / VKM B-2412 / 2002) TaxID=632348 RepID=E4SC00_CALK2|nr:DNA replication and repair protein RecF [Caldicellulosiruptor kronotskyensis]ADQ44925.1 DNA replication and repair protein RecF [Caldicellulosiruptor kronotskyensis 2002]
MKIKSIYVENFRGYKQRFFEFKDKMNLIVGNNASGKTSLLEALYFCMCGKSFKSRDIDAINFDSFYFKLEMLAEVGDTEYNVFCYVDKALDKRIMINDKKIKKLSELISTFKFVFFEPDATELIKHQPKLRRRFLDMEVTKLYPYMTKVYSEYHRALLSRNAFLKSYDKKDIIDVYDMQISQLGFLIFQKRQEVINKLSIEAQKIFSLVFENKSMLELKYMPSIIASNDKEYYKEIKKNIDKDLSFGYTTKGVHRDDFEILIDKKPAINFASEGQIKLAAISVVLATSLLYPEPVLILDDVFSELDSFKRKNLVKFISQYQSFVTSAEDLSVLEREGILEFGSANLIFLERSM